jgi:membrane-associated phospholipid phosphatase
MLEMNIWYIITLMGAPELWILISAGLTGIYFILRWKKPGTSMRRGLRFFLILLIPSLIILLGTTNILKLSFQIPRSCIPCTQEQERCNPYCPADPMNYSFPSGHAGTIFAVFTCLYFLIKKKKFLLIFIIPIIIAASRLVLGVHTLIDVVGGAILGILIALMVWKLYTRV